MPTGRTSARSAVSSPDVGGKMYEAFLAELSRFENSRKWAIASRQQATKIDNSREATGNSRKNAEASEICLEGETKENRFEREDGIIKIWLL